MKNEIDGIDEIDEIDGIKVFNPEISNEHEDYNSKILDELYNAENKLFWSIYRKEFILDIFLSYVSKESNIIEI